MPPRVQPIYTDDPGPLPATFDLPPSLSLEISSIRARVNGAGAASAFILVCETLTDDGRIMTQSRIDQEFAVGDTVSATWAPFLRRATSSTPPPAAGACDLLVVQSSGYATDVAGLTQVPVSTIASNGPQTHFQVNASGNVELLLAGLYLYHVQATPVGFAAGDLFDVVVDLPGTVDGNWFPWNPSGIVRDFRETVIRSGNPRFTGGVGFGADPASPIAARIRAQAFDSTFTNIALSATITVGWTFIGGFA